jgi:class 3 adenylate cyclase
VERGQEELLQDVISVVADRFSPDVIRLGLAGDDGVTFPDLLRSGPWPEDGDRYSRDLMVGGERSGVIEFARIGTTFQERDVAIMDTLAAEVGIALDNVRLYRQLEGLFHSYLSPDVADTLRSDPSRAGLGGSTAEVSVLFADLRGFTSFSEGSDPEEVLNLLNRYFGVAVPAVLRNAGTVVQFVGDAMLAVFDIPEPNPDHEFRAAQTALEMQELIRITAGDDPDAPRFRIGINTGTVLVGNIGSAELRTFSVVGDAVNIASRLESSAEPGTVVLGESTYRAIADRVKVTPLGPLELKGKEIPTHAYRLERILSS